MLKKLRLSNCFTHHNAVFHFDQGLTAITGPNESGKSLILEMVRYALFGSPALRGSVSDLRGAEVELTFQVGSKEYSVYRKNSKAELYETSVGKIASGTSVVNAKVPEILGYGLQVFDVANCANQGEIEALSSMRPSDRKKMVDSVIGLTALDELIADAKNISREERNVATALREQLIEPEKPQKPKGYRDSSEVKPELEQTQALASEASEIRGWLSSEREVPVAPLTDVVETSDQLQAIQDQRKEILDRIDELKRERERLPLPHLSLEEIDQHEANLYQYRRWQKMQEILRDLGPKPEWDWDQITQAKDWLDRYQKYRRHWELVSEGSITCPHCEGDVPKLQNMIEEEGLTDVPHYVERPDFTQADVQREEERWSRWNDGVLAESLEQYSDLPERVDAPPYDEARLDNERKAHDNQDRFQEIENELEQLRSKLPVDRSDDLKRRLRYEAADRAYQKAKADYDAWLQEKQQKEQRLKELQGVDQKLRDLQTAYEQARSYEQAVLDYEDRMADYNRNLDQVRDHEYAADQHNKARAALTELKARVKSHLVPSLNRAASALLSDMTGGKRNTIQVDEDFNIEVDGQPISTLSGSAKAVANLALRISLGQVLTAKQFSVFLGDEIDAAMDQERAGYTGECMANLTSKIGQVVMVSHKDWAADQVIDLSERVAEAA